MTEADLIPVAPATADSTSLIGAKDALLEATLPHVLFDGWSRTALDHGATALGLTPGGISGLFPEGVAELRRWLDDWADRRMVESYENGTAGGLRTHQRVGACIQARFGVLAPYREAVRLALAARFHPLGAIEAGRAVYRTVDTVWYTVGDGATDFSYYTKRGILAGLYTAAMLYWLNDRSDDAADTRDFIERRLSQIGNAPSIEVRLRNIVRDLGAPFAVMKRDLRH